MRFRRLYADSDYFSFQSVFDDLEGPELLKARSRSNPFESIRNGIFLNRAAMKMANLDAICDFMFTQPKDEYNVRIKRIANSNYYRDQMCLLMYFSCVGMT